MNSFWMPKKQPLYAPMLSTFGGGSARGFNPGGSGGVDVFTFSSINFSGAASGSDSGNNAPSVLGHAFAPNGSYIYAPEFQGDRLSYKACTTPFVFPGALSTLSSVGGVTLDNPSGVWCSLNGTKFAIQERGTGNKVHTYTLSTPYDPTSATLISSKDVGSNFGTPNGCYFSEDGSKFGLFAQSSGTIAMFNCPTPFTLPSGTLSSSSTSSEHTFSPGSSGIPGSFNMLGASMDPSGKWVFISNHNESHYNNAHIYYANLSTAWDISTIGTVNSFRYDSFVQNHNSEGSSNTIVAYPEYGRFSTSGYSPGHIQVIEGIVFS